MKENKATTADVVKSETIDFGVAFDGDLGRWFFFDKCGQFAPGESGQQDNQHRKPEKTDNGLGRDANWDIFR